MEEHASAPQDPYLNDPEFDTATLFVVWRCRVPSIAPRSFEAWPRQTLPIRMGIAGFVPQDLFRKGSKYLGAKSHDRCRLTHGYGESGAATSLMSGRVLQ